MVLGENPKVVADRLCYSNSPIQVTLEIYSHLSMELKIQTAKKFEQDFLKTMCNFCAIWEYVGQSII